MGRAVKTERLREKCICVVTGVYAFRLNFSICIVVNDM